MEEKRLLQILGEIDEKYVEEAAPDKREDYNHKTMKKTLLLRRLFQWGAVAACLIAACVITVSYFGKKQDEQMAVSGDLAPMVFVNDTLYLQSAYQVSFAQQKEEFEYLGVITDEVDSSKVPAKEFQANDPITGAAVYQYGRDIVVQIDGEYWLYESRGEETMLAEGDEDDLSETQTSSNADYPFLIMIDGQLYQDSGDVITDVSSDEPDGEIVSSCDGEPTENNQSNFGAGYRYQYGEDGENYTIMVRFEDGWHVFIPFGAKKDIDWDSLSEQEKMEIDPMYHGG